MTTKHTDQPSRCIWMDAGVVACKLCDMEFRCDECAFDAIMRRPVFDANVSNVAAIDPLPDMTVTALDRYFSSFDPLQFPGDRTYVSGHLWIRHEDDTSITIGLDHVAASLVGPLAAIVLPHHPTHLVRHSPCCWLVHDEGTIGISSPFDGTVIQYNQELATNPALLADKPYTRGWVVKAFVDASSGKFSEGRSASENAQSVARELLRLKDEISSRLHSRPDIGPSALDGGFPIRSPFEMVGPAAFALLARLFIPLRN
ncbi:MAG: glycine cleavage system protein H [Bacteroidota bacterium]